jgi:hypothetical protein
MEAVLKKRNFRDITDWGYSMCLACVRPWVLCPALRQREREKIL